MGEAGGRTLTKKEMDRLRRDVPLLHVVYHVEQKATEIEALGALPAPILPARVLSGFGLWAACFVLDELAACGDAKAAAWSADLKKSRDNYRRGSPTALDAVDPSADPSGTPSTRDESV